MFLQKLTCIFASGLTTQLQDNILINATESSNTDQSEIFVHKTATIPTQDILIDNELETQQALTANITQELSNSPALSPKQSKDINELKTINLNQKLEMVPESPYEEESNGNLINQSEGTPIKMDKRDSNSTNQPIETMTLEDNKRAKDKSTKQKADSPLTQPIKTTNIASIKHENPTVESATLTASKQQETKCTEVSHNPKLYKEQTDSSVSVSSNVNNSSSINTDRKASSDKGN